MAGQEEEEEMDELSGSKEMGRVSFEKEGYSRRTWKRDERAFSSPPFIPETPKHTSLCLPKSSTPQGMEDVSSRDLPTIP